MDALTFDLVWKLIALLTLFLGALFSLGRLLLAQIDRRLETRFKTIEGEAKQWQDLERDFLRFQAELPLHYLRREDYVRGQSVIEAKLDAIASELKRVQIDGATRGNKR